MIAYFPTIYEDELVYSVFARYYQKTGYVAYRDVSADLYSNPNMRPDTEFINPLTEDAVNMLCKQKSMEQIIMEHTMFPHYGRFLPVDRRRVAFDWMVHTRGKCTDVVPMRITNGKERYLRYCPLCVKEHRETYGETYWMRMHQCPDIRICIKHNVFLQNGSVTMAGNISPNLIPAELDIPEESKVEYNHNRQEYNVSKYIHDVFMSPMQMDNDVFIHRFLHNKLAGTKYLSQRGGARRITDLYNDIVDYYRNLVICKYDRQWYLEQVFTGKRCYLLDIALLAYFLEISVNELVNPELDVEDLTKQFDEQVKELHGKGLNYRQIAHELDASYDVCKTIGRDAYNKYRYQRYPKKQRDTAMNIEAMDMEYLEKVKEAVAKIYGDGTVRPKRVTIHNVANEIGLPNTRLQRMQRCVSIIMDKYESYEEYFAREVIWAAKIILSESRELNYTAISKLTNLRRKHFDACKPYLDKFADKKLADRIRRL